MKGRSWLCVMAIAVSACGAEYEDAAEDSGDETQDTRIAATISFATSATDPQPAPTQSATIVAARSVRVYYSPARLAECAEITNGRIAYGGIEGYYQLGADAPTHFKLGRYWTGNQTFVTITPAHAGDLQVWFHGTSPRCSDARAYDSDGGRNYHFQVASGSTSADAGGLPSDAGSPVHDAGPVDHFVPGESMVAHGTGYTSQITHCERADYTCAAYSSDSRIPDCRVSFTMARVNGQLTVTVSSMGRSTYSQNEAERLFVNRSFTLDSNGQISSPSSGGAYGGSTRYTIRATDTGVSFDLGAWATIEYPSCGLGSTCGDNSVSTSCQATYNWTR